MSFTAPPDFAIAMYVIAILLIIAYALAWAASTIPELWHGRVITPAENPSGALFWWLKSDKQ